MKTVLVRIDNSFPWVTFRVRENAIHSVHLSLIWIGCIPGYITGRKSNVWSCLITAKIERPDLRLICLAEFAVCDVAVLLGKLDILVQRRLDWSSVSESIFFDILFDIMLLMDVRFPRLLFYVHAQIPGGFDLVGNGKLLGFRPSHLCHPHELQV